MFNFLKNNKKIDIYSLHQRARNNDLDAQYELVLVYYRGIDVPKNLKKSMYWFHKANAYLNND